MRTFRFLITDVASHLDQYKIYAINDKGDTLSSILKSSTHTQLYNYDELVRYTNDITNNSAISTLKVWACSPAIVVIKTLNAQ